jgi:non-ribosomal peptide synthetase component F
LAYWKEQLRGDLPILQVPTDRPRPPVQTYRGASHSFALNAELTARLKEIAHQEGVSVSMALLSLYQIFLHRYTGQVDILVGSPTAGRNSAKYRDVIGYFVNPVVLRAHFTEGLSFTDFLAQVRQTVLGALQHQEYPFPLLVEQLQPKRDPSFSPLFQTMFVLQKSHVLDDQGLTAFALSESGAKMNAGELTFEAVSLEQRAAQFDLTLSMAEVDGRIVASFAYNTDLFDNSTMVRMAEHFQTLSASLLADPHACLTAAPVLTVAEKQRMLYDWNATATDVNLEQCLHHVFEQQVEKTPDHIADAYAEKQMS